MCTIQEARLRLIAGEDVRFSSAVSEQHRTIPAVWIEEAVRQSARVAIANAVIRGPLRLRYAYFRREFSLLRCQVTGNADFSCATFEQNLILSGTVFHQGADFRSASILYAARIARSKFFGTARFTDLQVRGRLSAQGVMFGSGVKARFDRARFDSYAVFRGAIFQADAVFDDAVFGSDADFSRATFADLSFDGTKVRGNGHFDHAVFQGDADFGGTIFDRQALFQDADFRSKQGRAIFSVARIGSDADFTRATFAGEVRSL